jgi:hypothetical protein
MRALHQTRLSISLAACGLLLAAGGAQAQDRPPIVTRAEQCLAQNVDRVVAAEPNIESAANFLLDYACAAEVGGAAKYERNLIWVQAISQMSKNFPSMPQPKGSKETAVSMQVTATVDPETGDVVMPKPTEGGAWNPMQQMLPQMGDASSIMMPVIVPIYLRKQAGDLVLAARERQLAKPH